jgi:hypothetical protein
VLDLDVYIVTAEEMMEHLHEGSGFFMRVGNFSIFIEFRGDEGAQEFKLPCKVDVFCQEG